MVSKVSKVIMARMARWATGGVSGCALSRAYKGETPVPQSVTQSGRINFLFGKGMRIS